MPLSISFGTPQSAYDLMGGSDPSLRTSGAMSLLMWEAIKFAGQVTRRFDFEGSMLQPVERFFRAFGGRQVRFPRLTRGRHPQGPAGLAGLRAALRLASGSPPMVSLVVTHPPGREKERQYACDVVLRDWLGLDSRTEVAERRDVRITVADDPEGRALHLPDVFFPRAAAAWLTPASLPAEPAGAWPAVCATHALQSPVPILFGEPGHEGGPGDLQNGQIRLPIDIFGSVFFLLSRYEEVVSEARDHRDRFAGTGSFSHRFGLLERPLANEYLEILWASLQRLWPGLQRRARSYGVDLSCDVDVPFSAVGRPWRRMALSLAADLVKRRAPDLALRRLARQARSAAPQGSSAIRTTRSIS